MPREVSLEATSRGPLTIYPVTSVRDFGVDAFVTGRGGGVSAPPYDSLNLGDHVGDRLEDVTENRRRVSRALGTSPERLTIVQQVHGSHVLNARDATGTSQGDALVSLEGDDALAILVADCVPLLLVDARTRHFALVHAGWRGLRARVIAAALERFGDPSRLHAFLGPAISRDGYQVGPEVAEPFINVTHALSPDVGDRSRLDLRRVAIHQLLESGLRDESIELSLQMTDGGDVFFSDRAQRPGGRFALVARRVS